MKPLRILALVAATASLAVGCTSIKTPNGWEYRSGVFQKQFQSLELSGGTNGTYSLKVTGYKSDAAAVAEAVASGVAKGLNPAP